MCRTPGLRVLPYKAGSADSERISSSKRSARFDNDETNNQVNGHVQIQGGENGILVAQMNNHVEELLPAVLPIAQINTEASHGQKRRSSNFQQSLQPVRDKEAEGKSASMRFDRNAEVNVFNQCPELMVIKYATAVLEGS